MPRPGRPMMEEKSKDFKGSMIRLLKNLTPWKVIMILALMLALISAILSLIAPNKLSEFADTISDGLVPNTKLLQEIGEETAKNIMKTDFANETPRLFEDINFSKEEKDKIVDILEKIPTTSPEEKLPLLLSFPEEALVYLINDIKVKGINITSEDQIKMIKLYSEMGNKKTSESALITFDKMPKTVYEMVKPQIDMAKIKTLTVFMATLYIISALFNYIQSYSLTTVSNKFANTLRDRISKKINKLPLKYFDTHETGDVLSRVTNDVDTVAQNLNNSLATLVTSITLFLGSLLMMFITNWIMALTAILSTIIGFVLMFAILSKSQKYFNQRQIELGNMNGYIEEMYSGHNVVKAYNGTKESFEKFEELNNKLYEANRKSQFLSGMMHPIMGFVGNFGYVMVCIVGAILTMNGAISFGVIVAFMIYIRMFTNPLSQIAQAMGSLQSTAAASERVFEFLDEIEMSNQKEITKHLKKSNIKGNIEFKNVKFGYDPGRTIIKNFNAKVTPGQKIAIVGPTGAGKTTMVNLLMKFYELNNGEIIIDGISTKELSRENIHDLFIMVLQDTWLFEGTIRDNIKFNKESITDREVWEALRIVGVDHFVKTLPGKYWEVISGKRKLRHSKL